MSTTSALLRCARCLLRCCGVLSFIAVLVFALASTAWCTSRNGRQTDIQGHRFRVQNENIDQMPILIADNKNGGFQRNYQEWQTLTPQEKETLRRRMQQLNRMPPQNRRHLQDLNDRWQQLSPTERGQLQRALDNWNNLSPSEKEAIRRRFGN
jgi:transketolase